MLQNKNRWTPQNYSLYASMQAHIFNILFALQPIFLDYHAVGLVHSIVPPIAITSHLRPSIAMTKHTTLNFQVTRSDKNISVCLRIEVSALLSSCCDNINYWEGKASSLKPNSCHHQIGAAHCYQVSPASPLWKIKSMMPWGIISFSAQTVFIISVMVGSPILESATGSVPYVKRRTLNRPLTTYLPKAAWGTRY